MTDSRWATANPNVAYFIAAMSGSPVVAEAMPGAAKSQTILKWANEIGYDAMLTICSTRAPEDFGGMPVVKDDYFDYVPTAHIKRATQPKCLLFLDEITTVRPSVRAAVMSIISERMVGDHVMADDLIIMSACNPPEMAPDASPLELAFANRFAHFKWRHDYSSWKQGMVTAAGKFPVSFIPTNPGNVDGHKEKYGYVITGFTDRNSSERARMPEDELQLAYPTPRSYFLLRNALAVADAVGAPETVQRELCESFIGRSAGSALMAYISTLELLDAEEYLNDPSKFKFERKRVDLAVALMAGVTNAVRQNYTPERMEAALDIFLNRIGSHSRELVLSQLRGLYEAKPEGQRLSPDCVALITEFSKSLTPKMREAAQK